MFEMTASTYCPQCKRAAFSFIITQCEQGYKSRCIDCYNLETKTVSERDALLAVARAAKKFIDNVSIFTNPHGLAIDRALSELPESIKSELKAEIEKHG